MIGSYHTALAAYAGIRSGQAQLEALAGMALAAFYGACGLVDVTTIDKLLES